MTEKSSKQFNPFKIRTASDQRFLVTWTVISFIVCSLLASTLAIYGRHISPYITDPGDLIAGGGNESSENPEPPDTPPWEVFGSDKLTFILLGYDDVDEYAKRSDTLMIGAVDFFARKVRIVSLPRDTLVYIPGHSFMKVNSAFALGWSHGYRNQDQDEALESGCDLARRTIEGFTGVDIDYVVAVNYRGFIEVIDALGGVTIEVEHDMHYDDRRGDVHIHIDEGTNLFDGETALDYARFRQDRQGDLGRIERQQQLMTALFEQALKIENFPRLQDAAEAFIENIYVSINEESKRNPQSVEFEHVISVIGFLAVLNRQDIEFHQIPVIDLTYQGLSCLRPIYSQTGQMLSEVFEDDAPIAWQMEVIDEIGYPVGDDQMEARPGETGNESSVEMENIVEPEGE